MRKAKLENEAKDILALLDNTHVTYLRRRLQMVQLRVVSLFFPGLILGVIILFGSYSLLSESVAIATILTLAVLLPWIIKPLVPLTQVLVRHSSTVEAEKEWKDENDNSLTLLFNCLVPAVIFLIVIAIVFFFRGS